MHDTDLTDMMSEQADEVGSPKSLCVPSRERPVLPRSGTESDVWITAAVAGRHRAAAFRLAPANPPVRLF